MICGVGSSPLQQGQRYRVSLHGLSHSFIFHPTNVQHIRELREFVPGVHAAGRLAHGLYVDDVNGLNVSPPQRSLT